MRSLFAPLLAVFLAACAVPAANTTTTEKQPEPEAKCSEDLASDPENCGACGNSCGGGACTESKCGAAVLASVTSGSIPTGLVVSGETVVWAESDKKYNGKLFVCTASDCEGTKRQLSDRISYATHLAIVGPYLYYTSPMFELADGSPAANAPSRMALEGDGMPQFLVAALVMRDRDATGFAASTKGIVLALRDKANAKTGGLAGVCPLSGCPASGTEVNLLEKDLPVPGELVATDTHVFATIVSTGSIVSYDRKNATKKVLFEAEIAGSLAQDDTDLAWGTMVPESTMPGVTIKNYVAVGPKTGGTRLKVAETGNVTSVAMADGYVYFADLRGTLGRVKKTGGDVEVLAEGATYFDLQVHDGFLYFTSPSSFSIGRLKL
jgi:hypothetical protein